MMHGRRHVQTYLGPETYARLRREAAARHATISKCTADCLDEYFALRAELATALETPGQPGEPHHGTIIHALLARSEERVVATLDRQAAEIVSELRRVQAMLDRQVMLYLIHTPEIPLGLRSDAVADAQRRYTNYGQQVSKLLEREIEGAHSKRGQESTND
jgi:hypothetical protein